MNNLTTRKIVLGLLMALVLAFSVQGIADALTLNATSDTTQEKQPNDVPFEIEFSVTLTSPRDINGFNASGNHTKASAADIQNADASFVTSSTLISNVGYTNGEDYYYSDPRQQNPLVGAPATRTLTHDASGNTYTYTQNRHWTTETAAFYYNDEQISVTVSEGTASDVGITTEDFYVVPSGTNLTERSGVLKSTMTLMCDILVAGEYVIIIKDSTDAADYPPGTAPVDAGAGFRPSEIEFLLRVTTETVDGSDTITAGGADVFYRRKDIGTAVERIDNDFTVTGDDLAIRYKIIRGAGTLYAAETSTTGIYAGPNTDLTVHQSALVFLNTNNDTNEIAASIAGQDRQAAVATILYEYTGTGTPTNNQQQNQQNQNQQNQQQAARLAIATSGTGTTRSVVVSAFDTTNTLVTGRQVTLSGSALTLSRSVTTGTPVTITLPSTAGTYTLFATDPAGVYSLGETTVTVGASSLGTLTISPTGAAVNGVQTVSVTARTAGGAIPSDTVSVTLSGTGFTSTPATVFNGSVTAGVRLPTTAGTYRLTVGATGYNSASTLLVVGTTTAPPTTTTTRGAAGEADSVEIDGSRQLSGTVDQAMRLRVRVLDANDNGVSDVRVTFRVLAPGRGTFAGARGNGRAVADQTDRNGYASANLTPSDDGDIIVRTSAAGVSADVTFIIDVGEATGTGTTTTRTPTPSTSVTPSTTVSPVVHVGAASRPPMLWVDGGAIYGLVGASPQRFASSVDNALNITVGGGKVYWTEQTGENSGTINSADLDGSDVTELASVRSVPMGIAVDTAGSKLYWTASSGKIKRANLNGSGSENVMLDLPSPMDLALSGGNAYWTQGNGSVRFVNLRGQKVVRNITPIGADTPGSLVIAGGKVYWTEQTAVSAGTINSANLNGTDVRELNSVRSVPMGIAVDTARSKLYWTASSGKIKQANLNGSGAKNVVSGLGSPSDMVLSNSIAAPAAATTTTTTTASNTKYDLNSDGTVDNTDAGLVADALGTSNTRYDVNGDGSVNFLDLLLVFDNRDPGAAGAPTIVGMKMSAAQIDIIEEQIDLLIATNDRSPAAMRTLIYLQQLIVTARPEKTQLLANYPNPFNPETWIPYELATDTNVRITIYNTQGVVIRSLQFGHQSAGYYTGRDRAAYWDGRNALGEQVSSGLYFYQLETDEMSSMRKMVILK